MNGNLPAGQRMARVEAAQTALVRDCEGHRRDYDMRLARVWEELAALKVELAKTSTKVAVITGVLSTAGNLAVTLLLRQFGN